MAILFADATYHGDRIFTLLKELMPGADLRRYPDTGRAEEIDYAIIWRPEAGSLRNLPNLKLIFVTSAGVDALIGDETLPKVPILRNTDPGLAQGIAEYVVYHVLHYRRFFDRYETQHKAALWKQYPQRKAKDCTIGFMGLGEMALPAAKMLGQMGFKVRGWSRTEKRMENIRTFFGMEQLPEFLAATDILINILPLTDATRGILNAELFAQLPKSAVVINIGRGAHLVESDLLTALDNDHLAAAVLDVFPIEPLPPESPLWAHPKIKITPHIASLTDYPATVQNILDTIRKFEQGLPLTGAVDRKRQY